MLYLQFIKLKFNRKTHGSRHTDMFHEKGVLQICEILGK